MSSTLKNILIYGGLGLALILIYVFFIKTSGDQAALVSAVPISTAIVDTGVDASIAQDFLSILLNVKKIKLDDTIFSDPAFSKLNDSSILLTPDGTEGRPNPFAPIGNDLVAPSPVSIVAPVIPAVPATPTITTPPTKKPGKKN